jgi:hypothetical protein
MLRQVLSFAEICMLHAREQRYARFPCAVVWQPFPPLTWILPMAGHTGITDSKGVVHDFQGLFTLFGLDMAFIAGVRN